MTAILFSFFFVFKENKFFSVGLTWHKPDVGSVLYTFDPGIFFHMVANTSEIALVVDSVFVSASKGYIDEPKRQSHKLVKSR